MPELPKTVASVLDEVSKPLYAAIGAGDVAIERLATRPYLDRDQIERLRALAEALPPRAQQVPGRLAQLRPSDVRAAAEAASAQARTEIAKLTIRGEAVVDRLRHSGGAAAGDGPDDGDVVEVTPVATDPRHAKGTRAQRSTATGGATKRTTATRSKRPAATTTGSKRRTSKST